MNVIRRGGLLPYRVALRLISLRVASAKREDWFAEWDAELWHAAAAIVAGTPASLAQHRAVLNFCHGAMADVRCLRQLDKRSPQLLDASSERAGREAAARLHARPLGSPFGCLAVLALLAVVAAAVAAVLPGTRHALDQVLHDRAGDGVYTIQAVGDRGMTLHTVRSWQLRSQHLFSGFASAQAVRKPIHISMGNSPEITVARASANLLSLLHLPLTQTATPQNGSEQLPTLILTRRLWQQRFAARFDVLGRVVHIGLQPAWVGGVVAEDSLPTVLGHSDAILLLPGPLDDRLPGNARVAVFGRLFPDAAPVATRAAWWRFSDPELSQDHPGFDCATPWVDVHAPWRLYGFALALALLSLPAVTSVSFGEMPQHTDGTCTGHGRRWFFLMLKLPLALAAAFFFSLDVAYAVPTTPPGTSQYLLLFAGFASSLFALQWALRDQRSRCPACLRVLTCPARVGRPSRNFLDWNGTELICNGGHGLLHIPDLPTSWFSHPRWLTLDPSWSSLFSEAV